MQGLSVSRVGGAAQVKATKQVAGNLRLDLAQFRELEAFTQFASDLDDATKAQLERGQRMVEITKQPQYLPLAMEKQVAIIFAGANGFLDDIPVNEIVRFEEELYPFLESKYQDLLGTIRSKKALDDATKEQLEKAINDFKNNFNIKS